MHEEKVRVAGLITVVRPYTTKTGKAMGFVTIEDIQGTIELVMFPKTWTKFMDKMAVGQIIIVKGKVDNANPPAKILVDEIDTEIKVTSALSDSVETPPMPPAQSAPLHYKSKVDSAQKATQPPKQRVNETTSPRVNVPQVVAEIVPAYVADTDLNGMPPPPDNFPEGWDMEWQPSFDDAAIASKPAPKFKKDEPITPPLLTRAVTALANVEAADQAGEQREAALQSMYVPLVKENKDKDHPPKQLTVTLRSTGDHERDKRRIKTLHGLITSHHGRDKFSFHIFENEKGYLIDFPNDTTRIRPELLAQLKKLIGEESWRVEEITFQ
jgi:DNA polymerase-3 subunit alpha